MAHKDNLRKQRSGTVINNTSEKREGKAAVALGKVILHIIKQFGVKLEHESNMKNQGTNDLRLEEGKKKQAKEMLLVLEQRY